MKHICSLLILAALRACTSEDQPEVICHGLSIVDGQNQTVTRGDALPLPLHVRATDETGLPISGGRLFWLVNGGGYVAATRTITDADGNSKVRWTPGSAFNQSVIVKIESDTPDVLNNCDWDVEFVSN